MFRSTLRSACFAYRSRFLNLLQKIEALPLLRQCLFFLGSDERSTSL